jgi:Tfp pilus assembly protein PilO
LKLTRREKILGIILAVLVFIWLYVTFVFSPLHNKLISVERDAIFMEKQVEISKEMVKNIDQKERELIEVSNRVKEMAKPLFSSMYQEKVIYIISKLVDDNDIDIKQMSFNFDIFAENDNSEETKKVDPSNPVKIDGLQGMEINIPFLSNYENLNKFLEAIRNYDKYINIVKLNIGETGQDFLSGNITLRFYAYPVVMANLDDGIVINSDDEDYIVSNPFQVFASNTSQPLELGSETSPLGEVTLKVEDEYLVYDTFDIVHSAISSMNRTKIEVYKDNDSKEGPYSNFIAFDFPKTVNLKQIFMDINPNEKRIQKQFNSAKIDLKSYGTSDTQVLLSYYNARGTMKEVVIFSGIDWIGWKTGEFTLETSEYPVVFKNIIFRSSKTDYVDEKYNLDNFILSYETVRNDELINTSSAFTEHKVIPGDTLYSISRKYYGSGSKVDAIKKYNNLSDNNLKVGKILIIPNDIR